MKDRSGSHRRRRLVLLGLVLALIPMTSKPRDQTPCQTNDVIVGVLICTPVDLWRILSPLARFFFATPQPGESPGRFHQSDG
jgi:hypothetical protein